MLQTNFFKVGSSLPTNTIIQEYVLKCKQNGYKCWLDSKIFQEKPAKSEYKPMHERLEKSTKIEHTFEDIVQAISEGRTIVPANLKTENGQYKGRKNEYFINTKLVLLDFDDGYKIQEA